MKNICMKMKFISQRHIVLLFYSSNMAAANTLYIFLINSIVIGKRQLRELEKTSRSFGTLSFLLRTSESRTYLLTYLLTNSGDDIMVTSLQVN